MLGAGAFCATWGGDDSAYGFRFCDARFGRRDDGECCLSAQFSKRTGRYGRHLRSSGFRRKHSEADVSVQRRTVHSPGRLWLGGVGSGWEQNDTLSGRALGPEIFAGEEDVRPAKR